ncbi:MAG: hypothetical protein JWN84_4319 [Nocardioides sp.]|nr:hypothetical protein [Nocardioides sp.]
MSEQSPWGTPPPSGPYGSPNPPPQPPAPPYQPPTGGGGGGGWSGGPPSYGGPPSGGQPPKRKTGLIVGIVAAVALVVAAFVVTLVVTRGDDEPEQASSSSSSSEPTSEATSEETSSEPTETTEPTEPTEDDPSTATSDPAPGDVITGDGYSYSLPAAGWKDASADAKELAATIDTAIILGASIDMSQSSIIVEALTAGTASSLDDLEGLWKRNLSSSDGATPVDIEETTLDGERAIGVRIEDRVNNAGLPITQVAYLALHDGRQYSIGLSFPQSGDEVSEGDFETMLASWSWDS